MEITTVKPWDGSYTKAKALITSIYENDAKNVKDLLRTLRPNMLVAIPPHASRSPLHHAVKSRNLSMVELILDNGTDVNIRGSDGARPLHMINTDREREAIGILYLLIRKGADVRAGDGAGMDALEQAVRFDSAYNKEVTGRIKDGEERRRHAQMVLVHERIKGILRQNMAGRAEVASSSEGQDISSKEYRK